MELELKHFTNYLHHNLKVFSLPFDCELELEGATVSHEDKIFCECGNLMAAPGHSWFNFKENGQVMIKPILKSLANCKEVLSSVLKPNLNRKISVNLELGRIILGGGIFL